MVKKKSYDFDMKRKYHAGLEAFIRHALRHDLKDPEKRKKVTVACFPGHEGLEVLHVYDLLGIERENVVGIEADPGVADEIESLNLGIRLFKGWDYEFFESDHEGFPNKFDVVNLDYQGVFNIARLDTLKVVIGKPAIKDIAVLATNFLGKRDGNHFYGATTTNMKLSYLERLGLEAMFKGNDKFMDEIEAQINEEIRTVKGIHVGDLRSDGITTGIISTLGQGDSCVFLPDVLRGYAERFAPNIKEFDEFLRDYDATTTLLEKAQVLRSNQMASIANCIQAQLQSMIRDSKLVEIGLLNENQIRAVVSYLVQPMVGFRKATHLQRGKYIGDNGSPMFFDFLRTVRYDVTTWGYMRPNIRFENGKLIVDLPDGVEVMAQFLENSLNFRALTKYIPLAETLPQREMLGSSYKPKNGKQKGDLEIISGEEARLLLSSDCTPEEIVECFAGFTIKQLENIQESLSPEIPYVSTREELHGELDSMVDGMPNKGRTKYITERLQIDPKLGNPQQLIACWTQARNRKTSHFNRRKIRVNHSEKPMIAAVARLYNDDVAGEIFRIPTESIPAYRAHESMGSYNIKYDAVIIGGEAFLSHERTRPLSHIINVLGQEYGSLDDIPEKVFRHHKITKI